MIHYHTEMDTPLGRLTLRATRRGLTGIFMEEHRHGPGAGERAAWQSDDALFTQSRRQLEEYLAGNRTIFDLGIDQDAIGGTPFQRRIWSALMKVAYGETISYGELARRIGQPAAVRAVGLANGRNPLSIVVPCHRIVGANGALTGYGGGMPRKRFLLDLEARHHPAAVNSPARQQELSLI